MLKNSILYLSEDSKTERLAWFFIGGYLFLTVLRTFLPSTFYWVMAGVFALAFALVVMVRTELGLLVLIFFLPFDLFTSAEIYGFTLKISQVIALLTSASLVLRKIRDRDSSLANTSLGWPLSILIIANAASLFYANDKVKGFLYLAWSLFMVVSVYLMIVNVITSRGLLEKSFKFLFSSAGLISVFGIYQFIGDYLGLPTELWERYRGTTNLIPRIHAVALEPLYWANYLLLVIPITLVSLLYRSTLIDRRWGIGLLVILTFNLLFTVSRGGWLGMMAAAVVIFLLYTREDKRSRLTMLRLPLYLALTAMIIGSVFYLTPKGKNLTFRVIERLRQENFIITGEGDRLKSWGAAFNMFITSPIIGLGVGNFGSNYHRYLPPRNEYPFEPAYVPTPAGSKAGIPNNVTLEIMSETGIVGLSAYLGIIVVTILVLWRTLSKTKSSFWKMISLGIGAGFIGIFVQYQFFSTFYIMHVWFTLGLITAIGNIARTEEA